MQSDVFQYSLVHERGMLLITQVEGDDDNVPLARRLRSLVSFDNGATWQHCRRAILDLAKENATARYVESRVHIVQREEETAANLVA